MGILDDLSQAVERGTSSAKSMGKTAQLKLQIADLSRKRNASCEALGKSVFEAHKDDVAVREAHDAEFSAIEELDSQIEQVNKQIAEIEAQQQTEKEAARYEGPTCPSCGALITSGHSFCTNCGTKLEAPAASVSDEQQVDGAVDLEAITEDEAVE